MRTIVFFDLPVTTAAERREYSRFRKYLIKDGFLMLQESVYCKLELNMTAAAASMERIRQNKPRQGLVQMLTITENQFARMEYVVGDFQSDIVSSEDRLVIL